MSVHDWTRVGAEIYHDFHNAWIGALRNALNQGLLPSDYYAMSGRSDSAPSLRKTLTIRHVSGDRIVALLEITSPANKDRRDHVEEFVDKIEAALHQGIHVLLVDLFAPKKHDPHGIHGKIWERLGDESDPLPVGEPMTLASFVAASPVRAYLEHLAVGRSLPEMPLFLDPEHYINAPLEATYRAAWRGTPERWRQVVEGGDP
jgi:hypothetical protein